MYRCRHELKEDPYASGAEIRRENRERQNRDIALRDHIKRAIRRGYGPPYGGHVIMPGHPYGLGYGGYVPGPPFNPYGGYYPHPGLPGPYDEGLPMPIYTDDLDLDDECPSHWYPPPPPPPPPLRCTGNPASPICVSRRFPRSRVGGRYDSTLHNPWAGAFEHEHYHLPPRAFLSRRY